MMKIQSNWIAADPGKGSMLFDMDAERLRVVLTPREEGVEVSYETGDFKEPFPKLIVRWNNSNDHMVAIDYEIATLP